MANSIMHDAEANPDPNVAMASGAVRSHWRAFIRNPLNATCLLLLFLLVAIALVGPWVVSGDPLKTNILQRLRPPSGQYWLGTDELGRSILVRIVYGAKATLLAGVAAVLIGSLLGSVSGLVAGYLRGRVDATLSLVSDLLLAFPYFLLVVLIVAVLGPSLNTAMIAIGIWTAPFYMRVVRASTLQLRSRAFVDAAIVTGESNTAIVFRHILPNCLPQILVLSTTYLSQAILMSSALSFLGLGAQPPSPEWGAMTAVGRDYLFDAPHVLAVPACFIFVTALVCNFLGDSLRDTFDPRTRGGL